MRPAQFKSWRETLRLTQEEAADLLGISASSVANYERGSRREDNRPVEIPKTVALACSAIFFDLLPWDDVMPFGNRPGANKMFVIAIDERLDALPGGIVVKHAVDRMDALRHVMARQRGITQIF